MFATAKPTDWKEINIDVGISKTQKRDVSSEKSTSSRPGFAKELCFLLVYCLLMILLVLMLASSIKLLRILCRQNVQDDNREFGPQILLFLLTLAAPTTTYLSTVIPNGWMLMAGAALTASGCASQLLSKPSLQISLFAVCAGVGAAMVFHATYVSMARSYCRQSTIVCIFLLLVQGLVMFSVKYLMNCMDSVQHVVTVLIVDVVVICVISGGILIQDRYVIQTDVLVLQKAHPLTIDDDLIQTSLTLKSSTSMHCDLEKNYTPCFITWVLLFSLWALGVDLTWLSDQHHYLNMRIVSFQCVLSLISVAIPSIFNKQIMHEIKAGGQLLAIGFIGTAGLTVATYPAFIDIFHLLFPVTFITQIMDMSDSLVPSFSLTRSSSLYVNSKWHMSQAVEFSKGVSDVSSQAVEFSKGVADVSSQAVEFSKGVADVSCQSAMFLLLAAVFIIFITPFTHVCYWLLMSIQMEAVYNRIFLAVLSSLAICVSLLRSRTRTATEITVIV